jgi:hypothetical protein
VKVRLRRDLARLPFQRNFPKALPTSAWVDSLTVARLGVWAGHLSSFFGLAFPISAENPSFPFAATASSFGNPSFDHLDHFEQSQQGVEFVLSICG